MNAMTMEAYVKSLKVGDTVTLTSGAKGVVVRASAYGNAYVAVGGFGFLFAQDGWAHPTPHKLQLPIRGEHRERWLSLVAKRKARKVPGVFAVGDRVRVISTDYCFCDRNRGKEGVVRKVEATEHPEHMFMVWVRFGSRQTDSGVDCELEHV